MWTGVNVEKSRHQKFGKMYMYGSCLSYSFFLFLLWYLVLVSVCRVCVSCQRGCLDSVLLGFLVLSCLVLSCLVLSCFGRLTFFFCLVSCLVFVACLVLLLALAVCSPSCLALACIVLCCLVFPRLVFFCCLVSWLVFVACLRLLLALPSSVALSSFVTRPPLHTPLKPSL